MDVKVYRIKTEHISKVLCSTSCWRGNVAMNLYEEIAYIKDVEKQPSFDSIYDATEGPLDYLFMTAPLQVTDVVSIEGSTWEGTYFCREFCWSKLNGFDINSDKTINDVSDGEL